MPDRHLQRPAACGVIITAMALAAACGTSHPAATHPSHTAAAARPSVISSPASSASPASSTSASSCGIPVPLIKALVADQIAQDKALQDDWWESGKHQDDLQAAIPATASAPAGSLAGQFNADAQTFLSDSTPYPSPNTTSDYNTLRKDIQQLATACGAKPPGPAPAGGV